MERRPEDTFEESLEQLARRFEYPPTPDIAAAIGPQTTDHGPRLANKTLGHDHRLSPVIRRPAWALLLIALLAAATFAIPQTRAAVLSLFARVGAIDIFIDDAAPTQSPAPTNLPPTATNGAVEHSLALFELGEPVALDEARRRVGFELALPNALDEPDEAYVHRGDFPPAVTLVWHDEDGAPLSLTAIGAEAFAMKMVVEEGVRWIEVGDHEAVWLEGPHRLQLLGYPEQEGLLIESNVLIWAAGGVTYRLEGALSEADMVAIAESMEEVEDLPPATPMD